MEAVLTYLREFHFVSVLFRLILAMLCGGAVGYGRSKKDRAAGLRTYMLVGLGSALAVVLTLYLHAMLTGAWADTAAEVGLKFDASRLAAQAIAGIGGLALNFGDVTITSIACALILGILTNLILKGKKKEDKAE